MLKRIREDSELGIQIVKKSVKDLVRRSLDEAESLKIRLEIRKKERDFDGITLKAGKMLFEKLQKGEGQLDDPDLKSLFLKAAQVKEELDHLKTDLSDRINPVL